MAGHQGHRQVVLDALGAEDSSARRAALGAAERLEILTAEFLQAALHDPAVEVRHRALDLLPRWVGRQSAPPAPSGLPPDTMFVVEVVDLLADPACAELAAFTLGELGVSGPHVVAGLERQALDHDDALSREAAVAALGALGVGLEAVLAATGDVATVRRRAVIALANFEGPDVDRALHAALDDRDWQVRQAAEDLQADDRPA